MNPIKNEPVVTAVVALVAAAAAMLTAFGVNLTNTQVSYVVQFVEAALVVAFLVRSQVTPKAHKVTPEPTQPQPTPPASAPFVAAAVPVAPPAAPVQVPADVTTVPQAA